MRKLYASLVLLVITFSCSQSEDIQAVKNASARQSIRVVNALDPTKLAKVVFYPGTISERFWFFYPNGLLKKIELPNGTTIQDFVYDGNQNLIQTHSYINSPYTCTFTYDANNHIISFNGGQIVYNGADNSYNYGGYRMMLTPELLMYTESNTWFDPDSNQTVIDHGLNVYYNNYNNCTGNREYNSPSGNAYLHDSKTNPFKAALLPICRALQLRSFNSAGDKWVYAGYTSHNNIVKETHDQDDPESSTFEYTYNSNNLPITQTQKSYSFGTLENTTLAIKYYYQGDVIP